MNEAKTKVLIVDDDLRLRDLLTRYLSEQGFATKAVVDGTGLDKLLEREQGDVLVLDLMLPGEDGLSICASRWTTTSSGSSSRARASSIHSRGAGSVGLRLCWC
jgi:DNA-binding response OmpR family regulator